MTDTKLPNNLDLQINKFVLNSIIGYFTTKSIIGNFIKIGI
jgi:hypothetical protein